MEKIWILGVGQFGYIAFRRLSEAGKERHFVLVDPLKDNLLRCEGPNSVLAVADGVEFLEKNLSKGSEPDWIVPALPVHLAAEWLMLRLGPHMLKRVPLPSKIEMCVPNSSRGPEGNLYVSHAEFKCPDNCDEPRDICTITREKRKQNMYEILENLDIESFRSFNIRSHQLGPGIGGYRAEQLYELAEKVERAGGPILLSTACRCHGVVTGLERF